MFRFIDDAITLSTNKKKELITEKSKNYDLSVLKNKTLLMMELKEQYELDCYQ